MQIMRQPEVNLIDFLESYLNNREATITERKRQIAQLQACCEEKALRLERVQNFSVNFFENRKRINALAMKVLDQAILLGDENVAEIALAIMDDEYAKDFFGMINKIGGIV